MSQIGRFAAADGQSLQASYFRYLYNHQIHTSSYTFRIPKIPQISQTWTFARRRFNLPSHRGRGNPFAKVPSNQTRCKQRSENVARSGLKPCRSWHLNQVLFTCLNLICRCYPGVPDAWPQRAFLACCEARGRWFPPFCQSDRSLPRACRGACRVGDRGCRRRLAE